jgi:hypothetical protein
LNKANDFAFKKNFDTFKEDSTKIENEKPDPNETNSEESEEVIKFLVDLNFSQKVIKKGNLKSTY